MINMKCPRIWVVSIVLALLYVAGSIQAAPVADNPANHDLLANEIVQGSVNRNPGKLDTSMQQKLTIELAHALEVMLPAAISIAKEKGHSVDAIAAIDGIRRQGMAAMENNDLNGAIALLEKAYTNLQNHVVTMRFGESLTVSLPKAANEQTWLDSKRRYEDWLFVANWLKSEADTMALDTDMLEAANDEARKLYEQAQEHARAQRWVEANELIDQAYSVMETSWREQGIDV